MATKDPEYLEYRGRANDQISRSKQKIEELKEQLAGMDVSYSKELSKSLFQESPVKTKIGHTYDNGRTDEKMLVENFDFDYQDTNINRIDLDESADRIDEQKADVC
jgi:hypothetical protein